jgi:hypothetical protein
VDIWKYGKDFLPLQKICKEDRDMLGINSPREPITPEFSKEIRAALWRATTGNLNEEEKAACRRSREVRKKWKVVWETK